MLSLLARLANNIGMEIKIPKAYTPSAADLPNVIAPVVIAATLGVAGAIMAEAALSFLGLGVPPPAPSWGSMIADGRDLDQLRRAPWTSVFPGMAIGAAVLGFNLLGDALRDALDPRQQRKAPSEPV